MQGRERELAVIRVLAIVEDHPDMRALLNLVLHPDRGFEVLAEASSAEEALAAVPPGTGPGVIVLDQDLEGGMTGLELAPLLKERAPEARIILFTAHDLGPEAAACDAVDRFVRKDRVVDLPAILRAVDGVVDLAVEEGRRDLRGAEI